MSTPVVPSRAALAALVIAIATSYAAGVFGPSTALTAVAVLLVGLARPRRGAFARFFERPRMFAVLGVAYLVVFLVDAFVLARGNPVPALGRLIVFLIAAETLSGDGTRPHRPVLFALLLMVAAASQTTDIWFALPLAAFALAASVAQMGHALGGEGGGPPGPLRPAMRLTLASIVTGALFFLVIPRVGAGWGRPILTGAEETGLESGLPASVRLGVLGRVKVRRTVAFRARLQPEGIELGTIYWRARSYDRFTGDSWTQWDRTRDVDLTVLAGAAAPIPPEYAAREADLVADVTLARAEPNVLPVPGRGSWVKLPRETTLVAGIDGTLTPSSVLPVRRYQVGAAIDAPLPARLRAASRERSEDEPEVDAREIDPAIAAWARATAPGTRSRYDVVMALVADLGKREYSLDTGRIDSRRPVASFLEGAPGHCEYFATALALGVRSLGIPARVVGGFLGAERQTFSRDVIVRDSRAHLWTEVHFPGAGWVTFDATPAAGRSGDSGGGIAVLGEMGERIVRAWDTWVIGLDLGDQIDAVLGIHARLARLRGAMGAHPAAALGLAALVASCVSVVWLRLRSRAARPGLPVAVPALYRRLLAEAARRGLRPEPAETAGEFALRAGDALGDRDAVALVSALYESERFGRRALSAEEMRSAERALARLAALRPRRRLRLTTAPESSWRRAPR